MKVKEYTPKQWNWLTGWEAEAEEKFYCIVDEEEIPVGAFAGAKMQDGTYAVFGLGREYYKLNKNSMLEMLKDGID